MFRHCNVHAELKKQTNNKTLWFKESLDGANSRKERLNLNTHTHTHRHQSVKRHFQGSVFKMLKCSKVRKIPIMRTSVLSLYLSTVDYYLPSKKRLPRIRHFALNHTKTLEVDPSLCFVWHAAYVLCVLTSVMESAHHTDAHCKGILKVFSSSALCTHFLFDTERGWNSGPLEGTGRGLCISCLRCIRSVLLGWDLWG